jgi:hypothetical protein
LLPVARVGDRDQVIAVGLADGLLHCVDPRTGHRWRGALTHPEKLLLQELLAHESHLAADVPASVEIERRRDIKWTA